MKRMWSKDELGGNENDKSIVLKNCRMETQNETFSNLELNKEYNLTESLIGAMFLKSEGYAIIHLQIEFSKIESGNKYSVKTLLSYPYPYPYSSDVYRRYEYFNNEPNEFAPTITSTDPNNIKFDSDEFDHINSFKILYIDGIKLN